MTLPASTNRNGSNRERRKKPPAFAAVQERAEQVARELIHSWIEDGIQQASEFETEHFPNGTLASIASAVVWASGQGIRGMANILSACFTDAPDGIRAAFVDCCEGVFPAAPAHCGPLVEHLRSFHVEKRKREIADRIRQAIDLGEEIDGPLGELKELETPKPTSHAFPLVHISESGGVVDSNDFVEGLLTEGGASVIYGPSNCGKSFWILDLAVSVATGNPFRDEMEADKGAVVYGALEGSVGIRNRLEALRREGRLSNNDPFFLCLVPVSLMEKGHSEMLTESVRNAADASKVPCRLIILDTLARAMAGGDENSGQDMGEAVKAIDAIREATGAHVCVIHHCGKDEARGARGHSSLRAAVDTEIEVSRPDGESVSTVRVTKQRDLQIGEPMPFTLKVVELGTDKRGKSITSCVVHHEDPIMASRPGKSGRKAKCNAEDMLAYLPADNSTQWRDRVKAETGLASSQFYGHKSHLEKTGRIRREVGTGRIVVADQIALPLVTSTHSGNSGNSD